MAGGVEARRFSPQEFVARGRLGAPPGAPSFPAPRSTGSTSTRPRSRSAPRERRRGKTSRSRRRLLPSAFCLPTSPLPGNPFRPIPRCRGHLRISRIPWSAVRRRTPGAGDTSVARPLEARPDPQENAMHFQELESRRLYAITSALDAAGTLTVRGDAANDIITVQESGRDLVVNQSPAAL